MIEYLEIISVLIQKPLVQALLYIVGSIIVAKAADKLFGIILTKIVSRTKTTFDDQIVQIMHRPIYYSILFIGLGISVRLFQLPEIIAYVLLGAFKTLTIILWSIAGFQAFMHFIRWYSSRSKKDNLIKQRTIPLFENLSRIIIFIAAIYFVFLSWNIDVTAWLASAGIVGIVLGLAAKDTVANLFAGIFIMADAPYKEGDYINLDSGERGYVTSIGIRSTRIMTRDDIEITIPNSLIANSKIVNESGGPQENERVRITVSVAYGTDIDKVRSILMAISTNSENVCKAPEPRVRFRTFGDSGLVFQFLFWIAKPALRGIIVDEISSEIYKKFNEAGIEIPFPQRTLHIKSSEDLTKQK